MQEKLEKVVFVSLMMWCYFNLTKLALAKGQLILKGLFAILEFFQKTNETIRS